VVPGEILVKYNYWAEHADIQANPNSGNHPAPSPSVTLSLIKQSCGDTNPNTSYTTTSNGRGARKQCTLIKHRFIYVTPKSPYTELCNPKIQKSKCH